MSKLTDRSLFLAPMLVTAGLLLSGSSASAVATSAARAQDDAFEALLEAPEHRRRSMAEAFLERHGKSAAGSRVATARSILGDALWQASCPKADDGLCIEFHNPSIGGNTCGDPLRGSIVPVARDSKLAAAAMVQLRGAVALAETDAPQDDVEAHHLRAAIGRARVQLADADLEALWRVPAPAVFDADDEESSEAFREYLAQTTRQGTALTLAYKAVKSAGDAQWIMVAAARTGMVYETPAEAISTMAFPEDLSGEQVATYCETLEGMVDPIRTQARVVYEWCIDRADEQGVESRAVETCRERLDALTDES